MKGKEHLWAVTSAKSSIVPLTMLVSVWKKRKETERGGGKKKRKKKRGGKEE